MAITVNLQPSEQTTVRFVQRPDEPPSLMITDGSAVVWLCPHGSPTGTVMAADFANRLLTSVAHWQDACRELATPTRQRPYVAKGHD